MEFNPDARGGFISTLVFDELVTELNQEIVIGNFAGVYNPTVIPWLYFHNEPAGNFYLSVYKDNVLMVENIFTVADLKNQLKTTDKYGHVWYRIYLGGNLPMGFYNLRLSALGYTYNKDSFLAWCKDWESNYGKSTDLELVDWTQWPLAVRLLSLESREI